MADYLFIQLCL